MFINDDEKLVLEKAAVFYQGIPDYILKDKSKKELQLALIEAIDALDVVEYARTKQSFLGPIQHEIPYRRKRSILHVIDDYGLTKSEGHVLRYVANGRKVDYIADFLGISVATVNTHKYSIFRKLGIHSTRELETLLRSYDKLPNDGEE